jgi:hypothetical protein
MKMNGARIVFAVGLLSVAGCQAGNVTAGVQSNSPAPMAAAKSQKLPCPIRLLKPRMVHNSEMDVYATVLNTSKVEITAIGFGALHTDRFGDSWEPYKTDLTSEESIKPGRAMPMHWEVLMEEPSGMAKREPGSSDLFVTKLAFADGRSLGVSDFEGCSFSF